MLYGGYSIDQGGASWESYHPSGQSQAILDMCVRYNTESDCRGGGGGVFSGQQGNN